MKLVTIASYPQVASAHLARSRLEEAGIPAAVQDVEIVHTVWILGNALGGIKLQVNESDVERATALLGEVVSDSAWEEYANRNENEDVPEPVLSAREELAQRAWRGSLMSLMFPPMYYLIVWMLIKVYLSDEALKQPYRTRAWLAALMCLPAVLIAVGLVGYLVSVVRDAVAGV